MKLRNLIAFRRVAGLLSAMFLGLAMCSAKASEMVYVPMNPAFGGSPLNGTVLLNTAQATNKHKDPEAKTSSSLASKTPLQQFNEMLERSILSQLSYSATSNIMSNGKLTPGTVETGNYRINIADLGGGMLLITTTDKTTGASTSFQVSQ